MSTRDHALDFLISVDPHGSVPVLAKRIVDLAATDKGARAALEKVTRWVDAQVSELAEAGLIKAANVPIGGALYLRAIERLRATAAVMPTPFTDLGHQLSGVPAVLDALEKDFLTQLLCEVERRGYRDPEFASSLQAARKRLDDVASQCDGLCEKLDSLVAAKQASASQPGTAAAAARPRERCRDYYDPIICGAIIVIIVIIIVVTK